jgi:hypothetical protein
MGWMNDDSQWVEVRGWVRSAVASEGRFNYLLHDAHVECLKIENTVRTGSLTQPKGMWTITVGD